MAELSVELRARIAKLKTDLKKAKAEWKKAGGTAEEFAEKINGIGNKAPKSMKATADSIKNVTIAGVGLSVIAVELFRAFAMLGNQGSDLSDALKKLTGNYNLVAVAQRDVARASAKGISNAVGEIAVMNSLLSIARDETESKLNRQRALKKINKEYKGLLPNMDLENVNLAENKRLTDDLTRSLIRKAKIQGAQSLIAKETGKILELQNQELIDNANFWDLAAATAVSVVTATDIRDRAIEAGAKRTTKEVSKAEARIASFTKTLNELLKVDIGENGAFTKVADKITKAISSGEVPSVYIDLGKIFKVDSSKLTGVFVDPVKEELKRLGLLLDQQPAFIAPKLTNIQTKFQEFGDRMASQTLDLASAVSGGFSELGRSLASGAGLLDSAGKAILSFMGSILTQLGQASIAAGVAAIALENLFSNPYTAIAAGAVLVALGAALSSAHSSVSGIGGSSGAVAGQGSGSTSSGGSSSTFVGGSSGYGEVVFRIGGQELIGVLSRVSNKNQRFGLNG